MVINLQFFGGRGASSGVQNNTVNTILSKYSIALTKDGNLSVSGGGYLKKDAIQMIKENKAGIIKELKRREDAYKAGSEKINKIPGLREIDRAISEMEQYKYRFNKAMNSEASFVGSKPNIDIKALYKKYPKAAAYNEMLSYKDSSNYIKSTIGQEAIQAFRDGRDWKKAVAKAKAKWKKEAMKRAQD